MVGAVCPQQCGIMASTAWRMASPHTYCRYGIMLHLGLPLHSSMDASSQRLVVPWGCLGSELVLRRGHLCVIHWVTACLGTDQGKSFTYWDTHSHSLGLKKPALIQRQKHPSWLFYNHSSNMTCSQIKKKNKIREPLGAIPYLFTVSMGKGKNACLQLQWSWPLRLFSWFSISL